MHNKIRINSPSTAFSSENLSENAASVICKIFFAFTCYVDVSQNLAVCSTIHKSTSIHSILHTHKYLSKLGFRSRPYRSKCFYEKMPLVPYLLFQAVSMNRYFVDHILHINNFYLRSKSVRIFITTPAVCNISTKRLSRSGLLSL